MIPITHLRDRDRILLVEAGRLHPAVTFTRASSATYINGAGQIVTAASNVPRFDYDQSGNYRGLLIEEGRTNYVKQSQALNTTPWGGTSSAISNAATFCGVPYWEIAKVTSSSSESRSQDNVYSAVSGSILTLSFACRAGTSTQMSFGLYGSTTAWGGSSGSTVAIISGPGTVTPVSGNVGLCNITGLSSSQDTLIALTRTYTATETARVYVYPDTSNSVTTGKSNLVTRVQVEGLSTYSSYIPTTTAQVSRAADAATVSTLSAISYNVLEGTFVTTVTHGPWRASQQTYFCLNDGTLNNRIQIRRETQTTVTCALIITGGVSQASFAQTAGNDLLTVKLAIHYKVNDIAGCTNNQTASIDTSATLPTVTALNIGHITAGNILNGWIKYLAYYPKARAAIELKTLTA